MESFGDLEMFYFVVFLFEILNVPHMSTFSLFDLLNEKVPHASTMAVIISTKSEVDQSINQSRFFYSGLSNLNHCEVH